MARVVDSWRTWRSKDAQRPTGAGFGPEWAPRRGPRTARGRRLASPPAPRNLHRCGTRGSRGPSRTRRVRIKRSVTTKCIADASARPGYVPGYVRMRRTRHSAGPESRTWAFGSGAKENRTPDLFHVMDSSRRPTAKATFAATSPRPSDGAPASSGAVPVPGQLARQDGQCEVPLQEDRQHSHCRGFESH